MGVDRLLASHPQLRLLKSKSSLSAVLQLTPTQYHNSATRRRQHMTGQWNTVGEILISRLPWAPQNLQQPVFAMQDRQTPLSHLCCLPSTPGQPSGTAPSPGPPIMLRPDQVHPAACHTARPQACSVLTLPCKTQGSIPGQSGLPCCLTKHVWGPELFISLLQGASRLVAGLQQHLPGQAPSPRRHAHEPAGKWSSPLPHTALGSALCGWSPPAVTGLDCGLCPSIKIWRAWCAQHRLAHHPARHELPCEQHARAASSIDPGSGGFCGVQRMLTGGASATYQAGPARSRRNCRAQ